MRKLCRNSNVYNYLFILAQVLIFAINMVFINQINLKKEGDYKQRMVYSFLITEI